MKEKYAEDIWSLVGAIKRCDHVPRVLLKNGKRVKEEFVRSQAKTRTKKDAGCGSEDAVVSVLGAVRDDVVVDVEPAPAVVSVISPHVCNGVGDTSEDAMDIFQAKVIERSVLYEKMLMRCAWS